MGAFIEGPHVVGPHAGGIDHDAGPDWKLRCGFGWIRANDGTGGCAGVVVDQPDNFRVVGHDSAVGNGGGAGESDRQGPPVQDGGR